MSIKEQITKLPDGVELPGITDGTFGLSLPTTDLKALADSHTRLLEAAKVVVFNSPEVQSCRDDLIRAIKEAEKI